LRSPSCFLLALADPKNGLDHRTAHCIPGGLVDLVEVGVREVDAAPRDRANRLDDVDLTSIDDGSVLNVMRPPAGSSNARFGAGAVRPVGQIPDATTSTSTSSARR
jgi:hypothetical protein